VQSHHKGSKGEWNGKRVRALRKHLGYHQQRLAREMGVRQQTVSEWETGIYSPRGASITLLNIIAERSDFQYNPEEGEDQSPPQEHQA